MEYCSNSAEETEALGRNWPSGCAPGTWWPIPGIWGRERPPLPGGSPGAWDSGGGDQPTFTIVNEYEGGRLPLFHFDLYRLGDPEELFDIGWEDYLARGGVCAVEWSENVADALEDEPIRVDIRRGEHDGQRVISIRNAPEL